MDTAVDPRTPVADSESAPHLSGMLLDGIAEALVDPPSSCNQSLVVLTLVGEIHDAAMWILDDPGSAEAASLARVLAEARAHHSRTSRSAPRPGPHGRSQHSSPATGIAVVDGAAEALAHLARDLDAYDEPSTMLAALVAAAVALVPGAEAGSISAIHDKQQVRCTAPTGDLPRHVDAIQEQVHQGPCLDAAFRHQSVRVDDLTTELRWPLFSARAAAIGAVSMLSIQLSGHGTTLGALNLVASTPDAFTDDSVRIGLLVAAHAAVAYGAARTKTQLGQALARRDVIAQAKGMLMERYQLSGEGAFALLTRLSQHGNRKLYDIAYDITNQVEPSRAVAAGS